MQVQRGDHTTCRLAQETQIHTDKMRCVTEMAKTKKQSKQFHTRADDEIALTSRKKAFIHTFWTSDGTKRGMWSDHLWLWLVIGVFDYFLRLNGLIDD